VEERPREPHQSFVWTTLPALPTAGAEKSGVAEAPFPFIHSRKIISLFTGQLRATHVPVNTRSILKELKSHGSCFHGTIVKSRGGPSSKGASANQVAGIGACANKSWNKTYNDHYFRKEMAVPRGM